MSAEFLSRLSSSVTRLLEVPGLFSTYFQLLKDASRPLWHSFRSKKIQYLKAFGLLVTIAFAGASLYYAKKSADYSRCQLDLARVDYCHSHPEYVQGETTCDDIFKRRNGIIMGCMIGHSPNEWLYSILGIYAQVNVGCGTPRYMLRGFSTGFWTHPVARYRTPLWDLRPAIERLLGLFYSGSNPLMVLRILPPAVLAGVLFHALKMLDHSIGVKVVDILLLFAGILLSWHPRLDPIPAWWQSWGHPYTGYHCEVPATLRPVLWRFPDAYRIAAFFTSMAGTAPYIALAGVAVFLHYRLKGQARLRCLRVVFFFGRAVLPILGALSWWLLILESTNERNHWETSTGWNLKRRSYSVMRSNQTFELQPWNVYGPVDRFSTTLRTLYEGYHWGSCV